MRLLFLFIFYPCFLTVAQSSSQENQLLWEITAKGKKAKSYLYGSLHSNDKRVFRFPDTVYVALEKVQSIVLETDIFSMFQMMDTKSDPVRLMYDNNGKPYTGSNRATKTAYGDENGMPQFLDAYFQEYAYNANKNFHALESTESQINLLKGFNLKNFNGIDFQSLIVSQENILQVYLKGDIQKLDQLMKVNLSIYKGLYDKMITERNQKMALSLDSLLKKEALFCAVGAGHLAGEQGLINLLRKKGYKLRLVNAHVSENNFEEKEHVKSFKEYIYSNDTLGIVVKFPGKPLEVTPYENQKAIIYREFGQGNFYSVEYIPIDPELSLEEQASIYIASPNATQIERIIMDDDTEVYQGISDTYQEGLYWTRVIQNENYVFILKASGGNKFMNSNRPKLFFSKVYLD